MQQAIQSHFARFSSDFLPKIEHTLRDKRRTLAGSASENSDCRRRRNLPAAIGEDQHPRNRCGHAAKPPCGDLHLFRVKLPNCNLYTKKCVFVPRFTRCSVVSRLRRTRAQTCACTRSSGARLRGRGKKARRPGRLRKRPPDRASRRCPSRRARARGRSRAGRARAPRRRRPRRRRRRPKGAGARS